LSPEAAKIDWGERLRMANSKTMANDLIKDPPVFNLARNYFPNSLFPPHVSDPTRKQYQEKHHCKISNSSRPLNKRRHLLEMVIQYPKDEGKKNSYGWKTIYEVDHSYDYILAEQSKWDGAMKIRREIIITNKSGFFLE
jgi:hypothetical protein